MDAKLKTAVTILSILVVVGILPAVLISIGVAAVSTGVLAAVWLLARRYEVI